MWFCYIFGWLSPHLHGRTGIVVRTKAVICEPGGGCEIVSIGWKGVSTTWGIEGWVGGSRYHIGIPSIKFGKFKVAITDLLTMPDGGERKGIV